MSLPALPHPKQLLKQAAAMADQIADIAEAPIRAIASALNIPLPERPRLADMVESMPDLPALPFVSGPMSTGASAGASAASTATEEAVGAVGENRESEIENFKVEEA